MDNESSTELEHLKIETRRDLQRLWELLMQPLGFRSTSVWVTLIRADRRPARVLVEIAESEQLPGPGEVAHLFAALGQVCAEEGEGTSVAMLVTRPGRGGVGDADRALAARLLAGAREAGVPCHPMHVADDAAVWAVTPDDLAA